MDPAQIKTAIVDVVNTSRILVQSMLSQDLKSQARRRWLWQSGDKSDEDMDTEFSQTAGPCALEILLYQLQKGSVWRILFCHWQNWLFFCLVLAVVTIIPLAVYRMMVAFKDPPPSPVFHAAAVCFGVLAETLLIKYVLYYCSSKYNEAKMSSFSVRARTIEQCDRGAGLLWPASQNPSTAVMSRAEMGKQEAVKAKEGFGLKLCV
ncbi:uncharacterized protein LOC127055334 isoform X3 [Gopherus flavomarginatus]|uniref:uncharacterized protein LOC127055334 isoform X3 n=1 Tax=Gopherus flavomarginatus TaxID=286002 RepID=UPI0021CBF1F3|nr:uncharacterized protein LOC127055334 isoform X3 [Gopherus flavomarginatus]